LGNATSTTTDAPNSFDVNYGSGTNNAERRRPTSRIPCLQPDERGPTSHRGLQLIIAAVGSIKEVAVIVTLVSGSNVTIQTPLATGPFPAGTIITSATTEECGDHSGKCGCQKAA